MSDSRVLTSWFSSACRWRTGWTLYYHSNSVFVKALYYNCFVERYKNSSRDVKSYDMFTHWRIFWCNPETKTHKQLYRSALGEYMGGGGGLKCLRKGWEGSKLIKTKMAVIWCWKPKRGEAASVRCCSLLLWWCDTTADGNAHRTVHSCGTVDMATVSLGNWPQDSRAPRDGATVCQSPVGRTGELNLNENGKTKNKKKFWGNFQKRILRYFDGHIYRTHLIFLSYVFQHLALERWSVAAYRVWGDPLFYHAALPMAATWMRIRGDLSFGHRCAS